MERKCIVLMGLQASGKTTFYQRYFPEMVHINLDTLHTRNKERILLNDSLARGDSFVIDNTNPTRADRARYILPAKEAGYRVIGYYFQSSIADCKKRNSRRSGKAQVPFGALAATSRALELPEWAEGFDELYYVRIDGDGFVAEPWKDEEEDSENEV